MELSNVRILNDFFREKEMTIPELVVLQDNYKKEMAEAMSNPKGCSKCKKNGIRRRFKKLVMAQLTKTE